MTLRALVVDDSIIFRKVVRDCIAELPGVEVLDVAKDGKTAIEKIRRLRPDLVTLDVEMPGMDGLQVLEALQRESIKTSVIMVSSHTQRGAATTTKALAIGAFDFILKPSQGDAQANFKALRDQLGERVKAIKPKLPATPAKNFRGVSPRTVGRGVVAGTGRTRARNSVANQTPILKPASRRSTGLDAICIGISTGGPKALASLIPKLSPSLRVPVLIVQHMPPLFTETLAKGLDQQTSLSVHEAEDGMKVQGGHVYIAPGGKQMRLAGFPGSWTIDITDDPPVRCCKPSVDYLFESAANHFGDSVLAVVMTGMGSDGVAGCRAIAKQGGEVWVQDQPSCAVYGMPRAVAESGLANQVFSLDQMPSELNRAANKSSSFSKATL